MSKLNLQRGALLSCLLYASAGWAVEAPKSSQLAPKPFEADILQVSERGSPATALSGQAVRERVQRSGSPLDSAMVDLRTGRFLTLMPATPLIAGSGAGNRLPAQSHDSPQELMDAAGSAFRGWLLAHRSELQINPVELVEAPRVTLVGPEYIQIYQTRQIDGVPVRDAAITATIKFGNLMLVGLTDWGSIEAPLKPQIDATQALARLAQRIAPQSTGSTWKAPELAYVPVATESGGIGSSQAPGLGYRLVHVLRPTFGERLGQYEVLVDAINGEVLSIQDTVHYLASPREVKGGVYPVSGDGAAPDGIEQAQWPMPFARVTTPGGAVTADIGGTLSQCVDGSISAALAGPYVAINDTCGVSSLSGTGNLDFGTSTGTDCVVPATGGGPGNTHAARTGYHELNMIIAMARSHLPDNTWLKQTLRADMNIVDTCNAGWNGSFVRFFRSGGGCANTGEQAGVFDHEWGHGMDNNDGVPTVSSPGEGIADIYASLRLDDSCIGRGFRPGSLCTGELPGGVYACTGTCTGVRDIDSANHSTGQPFTLANADSCAVPASGSIGPCGGGVHCEGQVYSQAVWDLWNRDLTGGTFNLNKNVARELATQLTFKGASGVSSWFACSNGTGGCGNAAGCGCAATSGYQQYLAADDDNGNLADGTPHMSAINAAFVRHGIACSTPAVTDSGCSGAPTQLPVVTTVAGDGSVSLSWTASAGASSYRVYRTDGVFGCDFGKILIGTVAGTSFVDIGLQNGRPYHYIVVPTGSNSACFKVASACASSTPVAGAKLTLAGSSAAFTVQSGDGDDFVDNCESARVSIPVNNTGINALSNVRILSVSSPSHPSTTISTTLPAVVSASLASCATSNAQINFVPQGLTAGQTLILDIVLTADELAGQTRTVRVQTTATEGSLQLFASKTFSFDTDTENWATTQGTFGRDTTGGGAASTPAFMRSSSALNNQCDVVESPVLLLAADSTLSLQTNFDIEVFSAQWWDRAHLTADVLADGSSTVLSPSGGRTYNATGVGGSCGMGSSPGWGGVATTWAESTFTPAALQTGTLANKLLKLKMRYGTDTADVGTGFKFDQLTVTNVRVQVPDTQSDVCGALPPLLVNGFEGTP